MSLKCTLETGKRHFNKNLSSGKTILPLSRIINHQSLPVKNILMKHWREPTSSKTDLPRTSNYIVEKRKVSKTLRIKSYKHFGRRRESGLSSLYNISSLPVLLVKLSKYFASTINFRLKDTLLLWTTR